MIKNKWKIEMWFQSFNYFIHKIDYEFILKEYAKDILPEETKTNYVVGEAQPNETIYISYFVNTSDQNIEQHTVKCSEEGIFIDKIPSGFTKDNLTYYIDSQSMVDIDELSNEIIDQGVDVLEVLESKILDTYFTEFLATINKTTDFAKKIANNTIKQIQENINLKKAKYKIDYEKTVDNVSSWNTFKNLKDIIIEIHQDLSRENFDDVVTSNFLTKYLIYKEKQDSYVKKNISNVNKSKYFKQLVTEGLIKERTSNSQYFDIANSIKPSSHKKDTLNQSDELNQFNQAVVGISLHLFDNKDTYFKFIRSILEKQTRKVNLTIDDVIESKRKIDHFMTKQNLISHNELYYLTTIEDTFHFVLFTALSDLIDEIVSITSIMVQKASQYDILVALHSITDLKNDLTSLLHKHEQKLNRFETLVNSYVVNNDLKQMIHSAINSNPGLIENVENSLLSILDRHNIENFYKRELNNNPNDFLDKLMVQIISKFYELRLKNNKNDSDLYY
ncbi:hypothetical protein [Staphylococcus hominis]